MTDLKTGHGPCPPMLVHRKPNCLVVTGDGDLVVGFGSDLALVRLAFG